jgi:hypothetical protein
MQTFRPHPRTGSFDPKGLAAVRETSARLPWVFPE